jgi:uncharacterized protein
VWAASPSILFVLLAAAAAVLATINDRSELVPIAVSFAIVAIGCSILWAHLEWSRWSWTIFDDAIELRNGVVSRRASLVPFHRIQQIDLHRDPLERMLGLSSLVLRTAAATSDARIPGIDAGHAEGLRHQLLARAGIDDAV